MSAKDRTAVTSGRLDDLPRRTLAELIARYGRSLCDEPRRCEGLLRDFCGTYRREIHVLVAALKERVAVELLSSQDQLPREVTLARLVKRLQDNLGLTEPVAVWAVDSWALALGVVSADELRAVPPPNSADEITDFIPEECVDTTPPSLEQTVVPPPRHTDVMVRRRCNGLVTKGRRLLEAARSDSDDNLNEQWRAAEDAARNFTEALDLVPGDPEARNGLDDALTVVAALSSQCGEKAYRDRRLARAAEYFQRALEIDPGLAASEARLKVIASEREELIDEARSGLDGGQPKVSVRVLERAREMFPGDSEIEPLMAEARRKVSLVHASIDERIPALEREKKFCELSRLIEGLASSGVRIGGLDQYKESLQRRLDSVAPMLWAANASLTSHNYEQALREAHAVLEDIADHGEALRIQQQASEYLTAANDANAAVRAALSTGRWFEAKRLLLSRQIPSGNDPILGQLCGEVDHAVVRADNHWRLVAMALIGLGIWLLTGKLAVMFSGGMREALLEQNFVGPFGVATAELAGGQTAQLFMAVAMLSFWTALLAGRRTLRSVGPLVAIVLGEAVVCGIVIWLNHDAERILRWQDNFVLALLYGAAAGILLAVLARRLLHQSYARGYVAAMVAGVLAAVGMSISAIVPDALRPEILAAKLLLAVVLCGLLPILGFVRQWSRFVLVPVAVVLAYGLELGAERGDAGSWQPLLPWVGSLLIAGAVLLLSAHEIRLAQMLGIVLAAVAATLLVELITDVETVPVSDVLLAVWFAVWGSLAIVRREHLLPNWQLVQRLRLWRATRAADGAVATPET